MDILESVRADGGTFVAVNPGDPEPLTFEVEFKHLTGLDMLHYFNEQKIPVRRYALDLLIDFISDEIPPPRNDGRPHRLTILKGATFKDSERVGQKVSETARMQRLKMVPHESVYHLCKQVTVELLKEHDLRQVIIVHAVDNNCPEILNMLSITHDHKELFIEATFLDSWWQADVGFVFLV